MTTNTSTNMEENKIMNRKDSIQHYCRVCTSNSKTKRPRSEDQYIGIFKKIGLKSILEKFLHLEISENDPLPKTICRKCFDKVMAVEFLQVVAKRSENLFKDFLANRSPKSIEKVQDNHKSGFIIKSTPTTVKNKPEEEVVVDVTMSDPLTKDIKKKLQVAQSKRDSMGMAFSPDHLSRNAVTSSPLAQVPLTIVHRMPKKRKITPITLEPNQIVQIPHPQTSNTTVTLKHPPIRQLPLLKPKINPTSPLRHISEAPTIPQNVEIHPVVTGNPHAIGQSMPLGSIIKDVDLLKLILKALKWPYNSQTLDIQIQRLKNTNFNDIIEDTNLMQDTDLIQILGPLIAPLPITMRQQTYHITIPPETTEPPPTTMSYKLPAETSVQIITVPATDEEASIRKHRQLKRHMKSSAMRKKTGNTLVPDQKYMHPVIVVSDDSNDNQSLQTASANKETPNFGVQLDPAVYPGVGENSNSNEAMLATLNRQREAMMRMHRSKRKQSLNCAKNVEMVDDIMIVDEGFHMNEPYPEDMLVKKNQQSHDATPVASTSQRKKVPSKTLAPTEPVKMELPPPKQTKLKPGVLLKPSNALNLSHRHSFEYLKPAPSSQHGFVKLKDDSSLPPLKKVKIFARSPGYVQINEPSKLVNISKNTTVADADSTTKIVIKETKVPKSEKSLNSDNKLSKAKKATQVYSSESGTQSSSSVKNRKNVKEDKNDEVIVVLECENECDEEEKQDRAEAVSEKKKFTKKATATSPETKKNDYKILATFDVSDDEMGTLQVEDTSEEQSTDDKIAKAVDKDSSLKTTAQSVVEENAPIETGKESESTEIDESAGKDTESTSFELPPIDIKNEENEDVAIKKEDIDSIDEAQTSKTNQTGTPNKAPRSFVASKTAVKTEIIKSTRSSAKRKVLQKEEEPPKEITSFRPARKSKTLSKYYKGPPLSGTPGRSMRSRT